MTPLLVVTAVLALAPPVPVGSKAFTEGVVLGEVATQLLTAAGVPAVHRAQLGGTRLVFDALVHGDIAVYAEYSGTLREELLADALPAGATDDDVTRVLAARGLRATAPLGFNNTYALAMREDTAARLGIRTLSDLARHPELAVGLSHEFLERKDGWPAVVRTYGVASTDVRGLDHDVAYQALVAGRIAITDCYTTDAEVAQLSLRVLADDRALFPRYDAFFLYRADLDPKAAAALASLAGTLTAAQMAALNARVRLDHEDAGAVAASFLATLPSAAPHAPAASAGPESRLARVGRRTLEHLALVGASLAASLMLALPLGVLAARRRRAGQLLLGVVGVVQTVPSLALLVLFVPLVGIGSVPAVAAMVLYGLLPIVRNTHAGLTGIAPALRESASALGLPPWSRLFAVELPLASPSIFAGVQTAAVMSVGTATIGALVGAGGYGQSILSGIRLADTTLVLEGAVPAAVLALAVQATFALLDRLVVPRGLRVISVARRG